jgi:hypothetical protein
MIDAGISVPADEIIPGRATPGGGAKKQASEWASVVVKDQVFHVLAYSTAEAQVVVSGEQALEQFPEWVSGLDHLYLQRE